MTPARPFTDEQLAVARAARGEVSDAGIYPDRNCMHRNMGPPELFPCCYGRGKYPVEDHPTDRYCDCAAGDERRRTDSE